MPTPPRVAIRRLALARLISVTGSFAAYTALVDLIFERTDGNTLYVALTILLTIGAVGLFEPLGGLVADRTDRKQALVWSDVLGAVAFLALALADALWVLLSIAFITAIVETPFRAGSVAAVPNLVDDASHLPWANGRITMGTNAGIALGPAIGGLLAGWLGPVPSSS